MLTQKRRAMVVSLVDDCDQHLRESHSGVQLVEAVMLSLSLRSKAKLPQAEYIATLSLLRFK